MKHIFKPLAFGLIVTTSSASAALVSVTTDASTGGNAATETANRTTNSGNLTGPAGDAPGSTWNIISGFSGTGLLDSTGASTGIGYTTTFSERRAISITAPDLELARIYMQDFGKGGSNTITINGLDIGGTYDLWLVSVSNSGAGTEYYRGDFITSNTTSSPSTQSIISSPRNISTFVAGQNFVLFDDIVADINGEITITADAADLTGSSGDEFRFGLNGFQIEQVPEPSTTALLGLGGLALILRRRK
ncbi:MAG: PEP-CTERM sorting domain-containing protein [Akkermansiaceae bacterium]